jgi:hypothetical protein
MPPKLGNYFYLIWRVTDSSSDQLTCNCLVELPITTYQSENGAESRETRF